MLLPNHNELKSALVESVRTSIDAHSVVNVGGDNGSLLADFSRIEGLDPDLIVCFDSLTRLASATEYQVALENLVCHRVPLLLSGLDFPPMGATAPLNFFEPLSTSLIALDFVPFPLGCYDGLSVLAAIPAASISPRDITAKTLRTAVDVSASPQLLFESVVRSRRLLGFFPDHLPRCIEYPWVTTNLPQDRNLSVVDVGSGVSVLPFMMAERGHSVVTVDPHSSVRSLREKASWTEWGFLDYSQIDSRIASWNLAYQDLPDDSTYDAVVSVSVIEHLPRSARIRCLEKAHRQLVPGGTLLLTVDTEPFSKRLWNYSEGVLVEDAGIHGTVDDLVREVADAGFELEVLELQDRVPLARVGMARVGARKTTPAPFSRAVRDPSE